MYKRKKVIGGIRNKDFPELYNWNLLDSVILSLIADIIAKEINKELVKPIEDRHYVGGLRKALLLIAQNTDIIEY